MSTTVYGIRCHRCLLSIFDREPRELYRLIKEHVCDPGDARYVRAMRAMPSPIDNTNTEGK